MIWKLSCIVLLTVVFAGSGPVLGQADDPSLMGWWTFDSNAMDSSGNGRDGTLGGDPQFVPGVYGDALEFDGDDSVTITGYKGIEGRNPFSVAAWIKTESPDYKTIITWGSAANGAKIEFRIINNVLRVNHGAGNLNSASVVNDGQWHHVALTAAENSTISYPQMILYVDGRDDTVPSTDADPPLDIIPSFDVGIGWRSTNNDRYWEGLIDEVYLYDRVLTPDEIKALALRPKAYNPDPADDTIGVTTAIFTWQPRQDAQLHDVYLGTSPDLGPAELVSSHQMFTMYYHIPGLEPGIPYYWRVDEIGPDGTVYTGDVWSFIFSPHEAWSPVPVDGAPYMDPGLTLSWIPGLNGITHDVYFGTDESAVADGAADVFKGNQFPTTFKTGPLADGTTYYWRIDEGTPAGEKVKGPVWSFTTLPEIPVTDPNLVCWWKLDEGLGSRVVDWSGHGHHGAFDGAPLWVEGYDASGLEFDGTSDSAVYSFDAAEEWPAFTVSLWVKAAMLGQDQYSSPFTGHTPNTGGFQIDVDGLFPGSYRVNYGGGSMVIGAASTDWVHLTITATGTAARLYHNGLWTASTTLPDTMFNMFALGINRNLVNWFAGTVDDLRVFDRELTQEEIELVMRIDPLRAWQPSPADGSMADIRTATPLTWTKGDDASKHDVYFGTEEAAVAAADVTDTTGVYRSRISGTSYTPSEDVDWGQEYFWRVDEVNADGSITPGRVWSFTVAEYLIVDDFESYNDLEGSRIYETWIDGWTNGTGAVVGNLVAPFAEQTIVFSGRQAMPLDYNNINSPWYSEAERSWATTQDWTFGDVNTLIVHFRGQVPEFIETAGTITMSAAGVDIWNTADEFRYAWKRLNGDGSIVARVDSITDTHVWAKAGVMIRETLDAGSRHAMVVVTPGSGAAFQRRLTNNDVSVGTTEAGVTAPRWVKLTRSGNTFTARHSADGVTWVDVTHATDPTSDMVVMGSSVYIGLALTSHAAGVGCTAEFSEIATTGNVTGQWQLAEVGVDHPGNSPESLYVAIEDSAGNVAVVSHPDPAATTLADWHAWPIDLDSLTGLNVRSVEKLSIGAGDRDNPSPDGAGRVYIDDIRVSRGVPVEPNEPATP